MATIHTADEISFLKRVLDAMFETFNTKRHEIMAINSMQAMKYAKPPSEDRRESQNGATQGSSGQGLTLMQAEKMLKTLVDEGWFEKSRKGFYSLSTRALTELRGWLIETYNDPDDEVGGDQTPKIKQCIACKEIITVVSNASVRANVLKISCSLGTTMRQQKLSMSAARHLHPEFLPDPEIEEMPTVQDGVERQLLRGRALRHLSRQEFTEQEKNGHCT